MIKRNVVENIFSNWASLVVSLVIAFLVSPIVVHSLGNELYGVWTLIVSVTGYFTVLDFGVNTAIVRYISSSHAINDHGQARKVYSTSLAIFAAVAAALLIFSLFFGFFFQSIFNLQHIPRLYLYATFMFSATDLAFGLLFSTWVGSLCGLQEFKFINGLSVFTNIMKNLLLVCLLKQGYGLLTLALLQLSTSLVRAAFQYVRIKRNYRFLCFSRDFIDRDTVKLIYGYSIYSFVIAIALKLLFYTDSLVIGSMIGVSQVTFYAIPSTLLDYLEKFVWAMIAVLVPVISANDATETVANGGNAGLYLLGTRYSLLVSMPIVISLYFYGADFIKLWMGQEIGDSSQLVLRLLLIGFGVATTQLIANGILKGISKHKVLAIILAIEALANLLMSVALAKPYGIEGVAFGTMVPLLVASLAIIFFTCRLLQMDVWTYIFQAYSGAGFGLLVTLVFVHFVDVNTSSYVGVISGSGLVTVVFLCCTLPFCVEKYRQKMYRIVGVIKLIF